MQESDILVPSSPNGGISSLCMNGNSGNFSNLLVATSWDNSVSCYELQYYDAASGALCGAIPRCQVRHDGPALCCDFSSDNCTVFSGGCDNIVKMWNVIHGSFGAHGLGVHDEPISCVKHLHETNLVVSGAWDKKVKLWDPRQSTSAISTIAVSERVCAMDAKGSIVVVGTADQEIYVHDLIAGKEIAKFASPLPCQTRSLALFADMKGFAIGCTEGRVALEYFDELANKTSGGVVMSPNATRSPTIKRKNFTFKCHREGANIYSINAIVFHPLFNTFVTCGSDGVMAIWDPLARQRVSLFEKWKDRCPITDVIFAPMGNLMAYSVSHDWLSGGKEHSHQQPAAADMRSNIFLHSLQPNECAPLSPSAITPLGSPLSRINNPTGH